MKVRATYSDLHGRRALVTGASSGIGRGVAEALLDQGASVAVHYHANRAAAEEVCHAALFLASGASAHLLGQDLCVSGGALLVVPRGQIVAR